MRTAKPVLSLLFASILTSFAVAQPAVSQGDPKERIKAIRDLARQFGEGIPGIEAYVHDPDLDVRLEAVDRLNGIGGPRTLSALITLTADPDPEIQLKAIDGIVSIYVSGYIKDGVSRNVKRSAEGVRVRFSEPTNLVVDGYVNVPPEAIEALTRVLRDSKSFDAKANAARALGVLRAGSAVKDLSNALYSKDDQLMFESLIALQKIRDVSAGPSVAFLVRDLSPKVQVAALQTAGLLRSQQAAAGIRMVIRDSGNSRVQKEVLKEAIEALAKIGDPADRDLFLRYLGEKDSALRTAGAEGLGRIKNKDDIARMEQTFESERESLPRLADAFAVVSLGRIEMNEFSPFRYLVSALNRSSQRPAALAYLTELAREPVTRQTLYSALSHGTKDEKTGLCQVIGESGDRESLPYLSGLKDDSDSSVAQTCLLSLRTLETRLR